MLLVAAALFVGGVAREHSLHHPEAKPAATAGEPVHKEGSDEDNHAAEATSPEASVPGHTESSEGRVLGVDIETWPLVIAFAAVSLGLALALLRTHSRTVVVVTGVLAGIAAVFDIAEIVHQANESQTLLAVIAATVAALHLAAVALAALILKAEAPLETSDVAAVSAA